MLGRVLQQVWLGIAGKVVAYRESFVSERVMGKDRIYHREDRCGLLGRVLPTKGLAGIYGECWAGKE